MKHTTVRRVATAASALTLTGALTGTAALTAAPTQAAPETCTDWQDKEFSTSGLDTDVSIKLCVTKYGGNIPEHGAYAYTKWGDGGGARKFDNFDVHVRLERNNTVYANGTCDYTGEVNADSSGGPKRCFGGADTSPRAGGWTADGYVAYNLDADGEGGTTWSLRGSPQIN